MSAAAGRRGDIEALRLVSALGIVWFHSLAPGWSFAYAGLAVFFVLASWLNPDVHGATAPVLRQRASRLLRPWLLWTLVYGLDNLRHGQAFWPLGSSPVGALMAGPSIHLWFLPFVFLALAGQGVLATHVRPAARAALGAGLGLAAWGSAALWRPLSLQMPYPLLQWADAVVPLAFGLCLQHAQALPRPLRVGLVLAVLAAALALLPLDIVGRAYALGGLLLLPVACGWTRAWPAPRGVQHLASLGFGVYLVHPLVLREIQRHGRDWPAGAVPVLVFVLCLLLVPSGRRLWPRAAAWWS